MATKKSASKKGSAARKRAAARAIKRGRPYTPAARGLTAGDSGAQVERLHDYLAKFGYIKSPTHAAFGVTSALAAAAPGSASFENNTTQALMQYQAFHGLPVTGTVDDATAAMMSQPRCGFPDVPARAPGVEPTRAPRAANSKLLGWGTWMKTALTYAYINYTADMTKAQVRAGVSQAFGLWSAVTPLTFTEVPLGGYPAADILIYFGTGNHGDGSNFDGPGQVLAHAFSPPPFGGAWSGDVHFDDAETWTVSIPLPTGKFDLVSVAAHEFGHSLGLDHSTVSGALMFPAYSGPHRFLSFFDVSSIQALYGDGRMWRGWGSLGGVITSDPAVCSWGPNRLDCFVRGLNNAMWHKSWNGLIWSGWEDLGGVIADAPAAVSWGPNRIDCFVRGLNNAMWHKSWDGSSWSGWEDLGGVITSAPAVCSWGPNRLDCFVRGLNNAMWHKSWNGSSWSGWEDLGGVLTSRPDAVSWGPNRIDCFVRGTGWSMHHKFWNGWTWSDWKHLGGVLTSGPAVSSREFNRLDCFALGTDRAMWHKSWNGSSWSDWKSLGGVLTSGPAAVSWGPNRIDCFARGTDNALWHKWYA